MGDTQPVCEPPGFNKSTVPPQLMHYFQDTDTFQRDFTYLSDVRARRGHVEVVTHCMYW